MDSGGGMLVGDEGGCNDVSGGGCVGDTIKGSGICDDGNYHNHIKSDWLDYDYYDL